MRCDALTGSDFAECKFRFDLLRSICMCVEDEYVWWVPNANTNVYIVYLFYRLPIVDFNKNNNESSNNNNRKKYAASQTLSD